MAETHANGEVDKEMINTEGPQNGKEIAVEKGAQEGNDMEVDSVSVKEEKGSGGLVEQENEKGGKALNSTVKMETNDDDDDDDDEDIPLSQLKRKAPAPPNKQVPSKKAKESSDDDDDDEDIPLSQLQRKTSPKKAPAKKAPAKKAPAKKAPVKKSPARKAKVIESDDDDDEDIPLSQLRRKSTPAKRKEVEEDEDSDDPIAQLANLKKTARRRSKSRSKKVVESEDEEDDSDYDKPAPKRKSPAPRKKATASSRVKKETPETKKTPTRAKREVKREDSKGEVKETRAERKMREEDEARHKWWLETPDLAEDEKWKTLKHSGVLFAPLYVPHGIKPLYDGSPVDLTPEQEEYATYYAQYLETDHVKKEVFRENFWKCWRKLLNPKKGQGPPSIIKNFEKVNFRPIWDHLDQRKEVRKNRTKEEKELEKKEKAVIAEKYGFAELDGVKERVGNYRVEPPGLFLGRGAHPKAGMFKKRITPEDITINIGPGEDAPKPSEPYEDWEFDNVISNNKVTWLATWRENVNGNTKYVMLHSSSRLKGEADMKKFEIARQLKDNVDRIRKEYMGNLTSKSPEKRQFATAMWVIDHLALRVGNEKGEDEADTVGCCSLRVEHVKLVEPSSIEFDFLGKDSMRYFNTVKVHPKIYDNFAKLINRKEPSDDVFDRLNSVNLNAHLKKFMDGLSAKVFRTFNASYTLEKELEKVEIPEDATVEEKVFEFNKANREVAILCNHQRTQSKQHGVQMEKIDEKMDQIKQEIKGVRGHKKKLKQGLVEEEPPKSTRKRKREEDESEDEPEKKRPRMPKTPEKCDEAAKRLQERLKKWELKKTEKDEMKTIALNTSKVNYIDPRLCVAWCKRNDVPVEKIFSKLLRDKFAWAMGVDEDWKF